MHFFPRIFPAELQGLLVPKFRPFILFSCTFPFSSLSLSFFFYRIIYTCISLNIYALTVALEKQEYVKCPQVQSTTSKRRWKLCSQELRVEDKKQAMGIRNDKNPIWVQNISTTTKKNKISFLQQTYPPNSCKILQNRLSELQVPAHYNPKRNQLRDREEIIPFTFTINQSVTSSLWRRHTFVDSSDLCLSAWP